MYFTLSRVWLVPPWSNSENDSGYGQLGCWKWIADCSKISHIIVRLVYLHKCQQDALDFLTRAKRFANRYHFLLTCKLLKIITSSIDSSVSHLYHRCSLQSFAWHHLSLCAVLVEDLRKMLAQGTYFWTFHVDSRDPWLGFKSWKLD